MPRLVHPKALPIYAAEALVRVYMQDADFMKELQGVRRKHPDAVCLLAERGKEMMRDAASSPQPLHRLLAKHRTGGAAEVEVPASEDFPDLEKVRSYIGDLAALADRWKLRSGRALVILLVAGTPDALDEIRESRLLDIRGGLAEQLHPWPPPVPQEIRISSWALAGRGRRSVQDEIAKELQAYESQMKKTGMREYPSALDRHAVWWFKRHVKGMKYEDIYVEKPDGTDWVDAESIKRAVSRFSRLVGIKAGKGAFC